MVHTDTDEALEKIKEHVSQSIAILGSILAGDVWGHDEYNPRVLADILALLIDARQKIGK